VRRAARFRDRGLVRGGLRPPTFAIFDPRTVKDESTFADPHRYPTGIPYRPSSTAPSSWTAAA